MLYINNMTFLIGGRTLFATANAHVPAGHRVGLVGANGSGKTTLLRLITGQAELDGGAIRVRARSRVGVMAQDPPSGSITPLEAVLAADTRRADLLTEAETATDPHRIADIHTLLADTDAHAAPARAATILAGLGVDEAAQGRAVSTFSGGWRMRVALAAVLFSEPDLLLLDEPTNHLDLEASLWLEGFLRGYPNTFLMVSHDRNLLNNSVDRIMHLVGGKLEMYTGGYDDFERIRLMRQNELSAEREKQETARRHLQEFVDRFRAKATKARQAQSRLKALARMTPVSGAVSGGRKINFDFPDPEVSPSPLIRLDRVSVGYGGQPILSNLNFSIYAEERIALLGANGNGKTTLARLFAGQLRPLAGAVVPSSKLVVGYFAQDQLEQLDTGLTALDHLKRLMPDAPVAEIRAYLGRFGFAQDKADVPASALSGGEKTRLSLAHVCFYRPNLMILDEPTNHLDVDARTALIEGLSDFKGALVLVSHDRHLVEATADRLWLVQGGQVTEYFGDLEEYASMLLANRRLLRSGKAENSGDEEEADRRGDRKLQRKERAEERKRLAPLKQAQDKAEAALAPLLAEKEALDRKLSDPATYSGLPGEVAALSKRQRELEGAVARAEEAWLNAASAYEEEASVCQDP